MSHYLKTPPAVEPVSIAQVKEHLRIDHSRDDATIRGFISAAREAGENHTKRAWCTQTWELLLDEFEDVIEIPRPPLQSITSVKYIDLDGNQQTVDQADYVVDKKSTPPRIYPAYGKAWPNARDDLNAITIEYIAGYTTDLPQAVVIWLLNRIGTMYENRETIIVGQPASELPRNYVDAYLDAIRLIEFP